MKNRQIFILFAIGAVLTVVGAMLKIMKSPGLASFFLIVGMTFEAVAAAVLIWKLFIKKDKPGSFMDN